MCVWSVLSIVEMWPTPGDNSGIWSKIHTYLLFLAVSTITELPNVDGFPFTLLSRYRIVCCLMLQFDGLHVVLLISRS